MSSAQERIAVMRHQIPTIDLDERASRLVEAIKAETRWQMLTMPARCFPLDTSHYRNDRASFVKLWPKIRNCQMPADHVRRFYDLAADQASILASLIEVRRAKRGGNGQDQRRI